MIHMEEYNEPTNVSWDLPAKQKGFMIAALLTGPCMGIMHETLLATALPSIQDYFAISGGEVLWTTRALLMPNGVMVAVFAFVYGRFATRGLCLTAIGLYGAGTLISALALVYPVLLHRRVMQASGSGIMLPLLMTVSIFILSVD